METKTIEVGSFEVNCTVIADGNMAWIVDPGAEPERIAALVRSLGCTSANVLLTHAHFDHIGAIPALEKELPGLAVFVHPSDVAMLTHPFNQFPPDYPAINRPTDVRTEGWPGFAEIIETPGHTPGGICIWIKALNLVLTGDTLFATSIGRTDFPGGDFKTLMDSLQKLKNLPDDTVAMPGHGPSSTIARIKSENPFFRM